jgi:pSer/pThr/pTyr-binding forkhead associated (FHA) protein
MAKLQIFLPDGSESTFELPEDKTTIGRVPENLLQIADDSVSSSHAEITFENGNFTVRDLVSTNGTFLNDEPIESSVLTSGDTLRFGSVSTTFISQAEIKAEQALAPTTPERTAAPSPSTSRRPANFVSSSPIKRENNDKDVRPLLLILALIIGLAAFGAAIYFILNPPA